MQHFLTDSRLHLLLSYFYEQNGFIFFLPLHLQVCAVNITEVLDRHENIRHILQVLVDTNSQLFQMRKWERKPDSVILVNVKCLMHSACPTMRETIPFYVFFSAFNKRVQALTPVLVSTPQHFIQHTAKGECWYSLSYSFGLTCAAHSLSFALQASKKF